MKISYDREVDVLALEISDGDIDHAEEARPMIIHLTEDNRPVLIEILDASDFLASPTKISARAASREAVEVEIVAAGVKHISIVGFYGSDRKPATNGQPAEGTGP